MADSDANTPSGQPMPSEPSAADRAGMTPQTPRRDDPEEDLWAGGYSSKAMLGTWILCAAASVVAIVVLVMIGGGATAWAVGLVAIGVLWVVCIVLLFYRRLSVSYRLTSQRFFHVHGLLSRVTDRIEVIDMDDITYSQGLVDRMSGVGKIKITSSDLTHPQLVLNGIENVSTIADQIDKARRAERIRRGVHIESV